MTTMAPPLVLTNIHCRGTLHNGRPCLKVLFRAAGEIRTPIEIKCWKCGTVEHFGPVE